MKTIERRVKAYTDQAWSALDGDFNEDHVTFENIVGDAFLAGVKSERAELTRAYRSRRTNKNRITMAHTIGEAVDAKIALQNKMLEMISNFEAEYGVEITAIEYENKVLYRDALFDRPISTSKRLRLGCDLYDKI